LENAVKLRVMSLNTKVEEYILARENDRYLQRNISLTGNINCSSEFRRSNLALKNNKPPNVWKK